MILASVTALLLGIALGYLIGLRHQSKDEVLPDSQRQCDEDILHTVRWEPKKAPYDMNFIRNARMTDPKEETIHNVPLARILSPVGVTGERIHRHAERAIIGAVKVDGRGNVTLAVLPDTARSKRLAPILRKAGIRVMIGPDVPR
ncbi:hypothetical protein [uncultured Salinicola sp.]|uniref:hypothetical protein n=1 Tax=uncultured Salinicola sp. TaxID=1193542 RepID=UPI0026115A90|nr:hypothetical protein [uncultured Salinicola sp.]|tara:strand:- start:121 stop:555 length:435 start_codon:yes stop_codon:yes gene_type:complete